MEPFPVMTAREKFLFDTRGILRIPKVLDDHQVIIFVPAAG